MGPQGIPGKDGRDGPTGPQGPAGPAGSGGSVASFESLVGLPCNAGTGCQGVTALQFDQVTFGIGLRCMPSTPRTLTVAIGPAFTLRSGMRVTTAPMATINEVQLNPFSSSNPFIQQTSGTFCNGASVQLQLAMEEIMFYSVTGSCQGSFISSPRVGGNGFANFTCNLTMDGDKTVIVGP
jgi:hypothetical protein